MWLSWNKYKVRFAEDFDNSLSWTGFWHIFSAYFFHGNLSEIILYQLTVNMFWYPTFLNSQETKSSVFLNFFLNKWCYNNIIYIYPAYSINSAMTDLGKIFTITFRDFFNEIKNEGWNIFILSSPPNEIVFKKCFGSTIWDLKQKNLWSYAVFKFNQNHIKV